MAFIFNKRNKNKKGSGGKKKFKWGKKKTKGSSKFASTELPVIAEEEQKREQDVGATDGAIDDATEKRDDVLDFGDISRASTDGNGEDFILNSYNTDGTIDGSQLKSDAEVPVVENTSFSQQLAVAAADAASMFQRMSSSMSVATAPVPILKGNEEEKKEDDPSSDRPAEGNGDEASAKAIEAFHEVESKEDTIEKDSSKDDSGLIGWPSVEEKNQGGENAKDSTSAKDLVANDEDITTSNGKDDFSASNDLVQFSGDATKTTDVMEEDTDPSTATAVGTLADNNSGQADEMEDEEDGSPFNVCTDLFRF